MDLDGILSLLKFLEEKPSDDNCGVPDLVTTVQTIIVKSDSLIQKIKKYLHKLKITSENMERVSQVLASSHRRQFLSNQEKSNILDENLHEYQKLNYYQDWFQYFLSRNEIWQNEDANERKQFFKHWVGKCLYNSKNVSDILGNVDKWINLMQKSSTNDEFQILIIDNFVGFSFRHGNFQLKLGCIRICISRLWSLSKH